MHPLFEEQPAEERLAAHLTIDALADHAAQAIACGADVVQVTSALLAHGPDWIGAIVTGLRATLDTAGYTAADGPRGILNLDHAPDPRPGRG